MKKKRFTCLLNASIEEMTIDQAWLLRWWIENEDLGYEVLYNHENGKYEVYCVNSELMEYTEK